MAIPVVSVDGVTATTSLFAVVRGVGAASVLAVTNGPNAFSTIDWYMRQAPAGASTALALTGGAPTFPASLGPLDVPGRYLVQVVADGDALNKSAWIDFTVTAYPQQYAIVAPGGGQNPTAANATIGGSGPASATSVGWKREVDAAGVAYFVPIWR